MTSRKFLGLGVSALVLIAGVAGASAVQSAVEAHGKAVAENQKKAAQAAADAQHALAKHQAAKAVTFAEAAVALDPQNSEYRATLGQIYLLDGRFVSAAQALNDALTLDPANGHAALNLALAKTGAGDWAGARGVLDAHAQQIPAADLGLAMALAGDAPKGVEILGQAVRASDANAKTRQNLALAFALAGKWQEAKSVASIDLPPDQVDARIVQWAKFSRPDNAYDQVASLLGVKPVQDAGQPVQLALNDRSGGIAALVQSAQQTETVDKFMPHSGDSVAAAEASMRVGGPPAAQPVVAAAASAPQPAEPVAAPALASAGVSGVVFAPRHEIVQPLPVGYFHGAGASHAALAAAPRPERVAVASAPAAPVKASRAVAKGQYFVQLGAYASSGVARDAWNRLSHRAPALAEHTPFAASVTTGSGTFYRLSVGSFSRGGADALCGDVKAHGGNCFVRVSAGDKLASWSKGVQVASR